jgi:nucleotide-binding universal stress UspA family protein
MWKRMLVPHDFSACAESALEVAVALAEKERASLTLLHVSALPPDLSKASREADAPTVERALQALEEIAAPLRARGLETHTLAVAIETGDIGPEILRAADETKADVIVIGTHGRRGLSHLLVGSVAEKLLRTSRAAVVTVRPGQS